MLGLITTQAQVPETLLLDLPRIARMRREYAHTLDILVVIAVVDQALAMAALPEPDRIRFVDSLAASLIIGENISQAGTAQLSGTGRAILLYQIADSVRPNHTVRLAVAHCLPAIWASMLSRDTPAPNVNLHVVPLIEKTLADLEVLCAANHLLHAHTYERCLRSAQ